MYAYYEGLYGPQRCVVVREIDAERVILRPVAPPSSALGWITGNSGREFETLKALCWKSCRRIGRYGTRHALSGRPDWRIK